MTTRNEFSFLKGWMQVPVGEADSVKKELMEALGLETAMGWLGRLKGKVEPKISEYRVIEEIFHKRNITDIWGE